MLDRHAEERALARSMSLLSTLSSAVEVAVAMRQRREGRDPSEQQARSEVLPCLDESAGELERRLIALRTSLVAAERESACDVVLVRRMNDLLLLSGVARGFYRVHQRLMSLYPAVTEDLVEKSRLIYIDCTALLDRDDDVHEDTLTFADIAAAFLEEMREEIKLLSA